MYRTSLALRGKCDEYSRVVQCMSYVCMYVCSETLLFLHQIFLKGLMVRMENWPTIVLGERLRIVVALLSPN